MFGKRNYLDVLIRSVHMHNKGMLCEKYGIYHCFSDVLLEIWENLVAVVRGQYDNMHGSPETVNKRKKKLLHLWKKLPLFSESTQGPQWNYQLPWTLS